MNNSSNTKKEVNTSHKLGAPEILEHFKKNVLSFLENLIEIFPDKPELITMRFLFDCHPRKDEILTKWAESSRAKTSEANSPNIRELIKNRNQDFFLNPDTSFMNFDNGKVNMWRDIWKSNRIDNNEKEIIWKWIDVFVTLAEKWDEIHQK